VRLSTSGSKTAALSYAKLVALICVTLIVVFEMCSNYLLKHDSGTYDRISKQYSDAIQMHACGSGGPACVLMVGNSLLLHGVQLDRLREMTSTQMRIYPIFLEATGYYDWLYALRRLFRQGAKPQVVVVGVGVNYFLSNGIRQDYAPMLFFDARDTLALASDLQLDRTATSNLVLAHASTFWDTRTAIRMQILNHIVPHLEDLFLFLSPRPGIPERHDLEEKTTLRLARMRELCDSYGAKLILLLPPTLSSEGAVAEMTRAARSVGVDVSVPINPAALSARFYQRDGLHLNRDGAVLFTAALAKDLPEKIANHESIASGRLGSNPEPIPAAYRTSGTKSQ
jgi:lysophospholipase L1-like esterase